MSTRIAWKKFGQALLSQRTEMGLGIREVAKKYGFDRSTVSRADRGLVVSAETFMILASRFLNADPRTFLK